MSVGSEQCAECGYEFPPGKLSHRCPACGHNCAAVVEPKGSLSPLTETRRKQFRKYFRILLIATPVMAAVAGLAQTDQRFTIPVLAKFFSVPPLVMVFGTLLSGAVGAGFLLARVQTRRILSFVVCGILYSLAFLMAYMSILAIGFLCLYGALAR